MEIKQGVWQALIGKKVLTSLVTSDHVVEMGERMEYTAEQGKKMPLVKATAVPVFSSCFCLF